MAAHVDTLLETEADFIVSLLNNAIMGTLVNKEVAHNDTPITLRLILMSLSNMDTLLKRSYPPLRVVKCRFFKIKTAMTPFIFVSDGKVLIHINVSIEND